MNLVRIGSGRRIAFLREYLAPWFKPSVARCRRFSGTVTSRCHGGYRFLGKDEFPWSLMMSHEKQLCVQSPQRCAAMSMLARRTSAEMLNLERLTNFISVSACAERAVCGSPTGSILTNP